MVTMSCIALGFYNIESLICYNGRPLEASTHPVAIAAEKQCTRLSDGRIFQAVIKDS